jgi:hypothetical protein
VLSGCQKFSYFSMKITDEFISKFKYVSVQFVCDVIYSVCFAGSNSKFLNLTCRKERERKQCIQVGE